MARGAVDSELLILKVSQFKVNLVVLCARRTLDDILLNLDVWEVKSLKQIQRPCILYLLQILGTL